MKNKPYRQNYLEKPAIFIYVMNLPFLFPFAVLHYYKLVAYILL